MLRFLCFFLFVIFQSIPSAFGEGDEKKEHNDHKESKEHGGKFNEDPSLLKLEPMTVPILYKDDVIGYLQIAMKLRAKAEKDYEVLGPFLPIIHDALFSDLYSTLYVLWIFHRQIEFDNIRLRLQRIVDTLMGKNRLTIEVYHQQLHLFDERY